MATWTKPEFVEISLGMELTAYVNTDDRQTTVEGRAACGSASSAPPPAAACPSGTAAA